MSDEYIKREDAIKAFDPNQRQDWYTPWIVETLKDLPPADVEPVVRCKDCKHCEYASNRIPIEQAWVCYKLGIDVEQDWFCADGERKDDE